MRIAEQPPRVHEAAQSATALRALCSVIVDHVIAHDGCDDISVRLAEPLQQHLRALLGLAQQVWHEGIGGRCVGVAASTAASGRWCGGREELAQGFERRAQVALLLHRRDLAEVEVEQGAVCLVALGGQRRCSGCG